MAGRFTALVLAVVAGVAGQGRIGPQKAAIAVAANQLRVIYHMLKDGTFYQDLGADYRARRNPDRAAGNLARRIRALGYVVDIRPATAA